MSERFAVDASVVIKLFVQEGFSQTTYKLFERLGSSDPDEFYVPDLLFAECANVLWKYVRFHGYDREIARAHLVDLSEMVFHVVPIIELIKESFELAPLPSDRILCMARDNEVSPIFSTIPRRKLRKKYGEDNRFLHREHYTELPTFSYSGPRSAIDFNGKPDPDRCDTSFSSAVIRLAFTPSARAT